MKSENLSIKEVARLAGTSVATVSRVINQNGRFSKETEKRVREVNEKYIYRPNELARSLRVDKAQVVGVIIPDITQEFFAHIAREIEIDLLKQGYMAIICDTNESVELEKQYIEMLRAMRVGGIIYVSGDQKIEPIRDIPAVYVDRKPAFAEEEQGSCFIGCDNYQGGYLAAERLIKAGRKNIAAVLHAKTIATQERRLHGYRQALHDNGIVFSDRLVYKVETVGMEQGYQISREIWESGERVDGIFYSSDILAIGGLQYFHEQGVEVPKEVSVIGIDDIPLSARVTPALTTVRQDYLKLGSLAAGSIIKMMRGDQEKRTYILSMELVERETV